MPTTRAPPPPPPPHTHRTHRHSSLFLSTAVSWPRRAPTRGHATDPTFFVRPGSYPKRVLPCSATGIPCATTPSIRPRSSAARVQFCNTARSALLPSDVFTRSLGRHRLLTKRILTSRQSPPPPITSRNVPKYHVSIFFLFFTRGTRTRRVSLEFPCSADADRCPKSGKPAADGSFDLFSKSDRKHKNRFFFFFFGNRR